MNQHTVCYERRDRGGLEEGQCYRERPAHHIPAFTHLIPASRRDPFSESSAPDLLENTVETMIEGMSDRACLVGSDGTIMAVNRGWAEKAATLQSADLCLGGNYIRFLNGGATHLHNLSQVTLKSLQEYLDGETAQFRHIFQLPYAKLEAVGLTFRDKRYLLLHVHDLTEERRLKQRRRTLTTRLSKTRIRERRRMAQELRHCTAGPLGKLELCLSQLDKAGAQTETVLSACNQAIQAVQRDVRALSFLWHPPSLDDHGFASALEDLVTGVCRRLGISSHVEIDEIGELPRAAADLLYSLAQNALDGVFHLKKPTSINLRLAAPVEFLHMTIEYDAKPACPRVSDIAMEIMEEQFAERNGRLFIHEMLGSTLITASLPHAKASR